MLLPALSKAREKARIISCTNKLKQIVTADLIYSNDNSDWLTISTIFKLGKVEDGGNRFGGASTNDTTYTKPVLLLTGGYLGNAVEPANITAKIRDTYFKCPSDSSNCNSTWTNVYDITMSYIWIWSVAPSSPAAGTTYWGIRADASGNRGRAIVGRDNPNFSIWGDVVGKVIDSTTNINNHGLTANIAYIGGHVKTKTLTQANSDLVQSVGRFAYLLDDDL